MKCDYSVRKQTAWSVAVKLLKKWKLSVFTTLCAHKFCVRAQSGGNSGEQSLHKGNVLVTLQREVLENILAASACLTVQGMNCSFNYYNSIMGKFFITVMHSTDPKQCFHCITVISFTKSVFPRLASMVNYGSFTQYSDYEVAVACCCSMLIFFLYYFYSKNCIFGCVHLNYVLIIVFWF